jgi:hypothetical protein
MLKVTLAPVRTDAAGAVRLVVVFAWATLIEAVEVRVA